ncbi:MAG TPA: hypothetical protein VID47_00475 [Actinomycetota bacterium]|jgi:hypothetical protein
MSGAAPLRFGIMCRGTTFPAWQARSVRDLLASDGVRPALLVVEDGTTPLRRDRRDLLRFAEERLRTSAGAPVDLADELGGVPTLRCRPGTAFDGSDLAAIRDHGLDFILRFAFDALEGDVASAAGFGVWSFDHNVDGVDGAPPCFREVDRGDPVTRASLLRLTGRPGERIVLHEGFFRTIPHSYERTWDSVAMGSADWPARVCAEIRNGRTEWPSSASSEPPRRPTPAQTAAFRRRTARRRFRVRVRGRTRRTEWNVGIVEAPISSFLDRSSPPAVRWLPRTWGDQSLADPFPLPSAGGPAMLAEAIDHASRIGRIVLVESDPAPRLPTALDVSEHASYPYVVEQDGALYCVPETARAQRVWLFRSSDSGRTWERVATLIDGFACVDPTVFRHEGRWWLFGTDRDRGANTKLHAWLAPELTGPWSPHPLNPLKTDVRSSRPAGTPFVHDGRLFRPAQDGSRGYGTRVVINEILRLSPTEFEERAVSTVQPDRRGPWPDGLHTLAAAGDTTLVDGRRDRLVWPWFGRAAGTRLR